MCLHVCTCASILGEKVTLNFMYNLVIRVVVSDERASASSSTTEVSPPPGARQKPTSDPKQNTPSTTSTNQPSTRDGITSSSPGVAMETQSSEEGPKLVGSKESRTVFVSNLIMAITEDQLRDKFSEVCMFVYITLHMKHLRYNFIVDYMYMCVGPYILI